LKPEARFSRNSELLVMRVIEAAALASSLALGPSSLAHADEGGVAFWFSGQFASLSAVPAAPGASVALIPYYYSGSGGGSRSFERGKALVAGISSKGSLLLMQPGYASETKILEGHPYVGLAFGGGRNSTQVDVTLSPASSAVQRAASEWKTGGTDLYPYASLSWNRGVDNWMTYLTGDIPVGTYNSQRLANLGIGHAAIDAGGGYTYFDEKSGREASAVLGVTYNWRNSATDYKNGVDLHLDWALSQFLTEHWQAGIVGYIYQQITADTYSTDGAEGALRAQLLGSFKSRVASVGPEIGYVVKVGNRSVYANLRAYWEFWAQDRVGGFAIFGTVSIPIGD
jgi:hypothetical protein